MILVFLIFFLDFLYSPFTVAVAHSIENVDESLICFFFFYVCNQFLYLKRRDETSTEKTKKQVLKVPFGLFLVSIYIGEVAQLGRKIIVPDFADNVLKENLTLSKLCDVTQGTLRHLLAKFVQELYRVGVFGLFALESNCDVVKQMESQELVGLYLVVLQQSEVLDTFPGVDVTKVIGYLGIQYGGKKLGGKV